MRSDVNRTAHAIAVRHELDVRQGLQEAVQALRAAGADAEAIRAYLARCAAAGRVLEGGGVVDDYGGFER